MRLPDSPKVRTKHQSELARQMQQVGWPKYSQVAISRTEKSAVDRGVVVLYLVDRVWRRCLGTKNGAAHHPEGARMWMPSISDGRRVVI